MSYLYYDAENKYTGRKYKICFSKLPYWRCNKRNAENKLDGHQLDYERGRKISVLISSTEKQIDDFTTRITKVYEKTVLKRKTQKVKCNNDDCNGTIEFIGYAVWVKDITDEEIYAGMFSKGSKEVEKMKFYKTLSEREDILTRHLNYYRDQLDKYPAIHKHQPDQ